MNELENRIKKLIDSTEYNHLIWIYEDGVSKTTVGGSHLELIDNSDSCERCCCDLEDCGCDEPAKGTIILIAYSGTTQFHYNDISAKLLDQLASAVMDCRQTPKIDYTNGILHTRETVLDLFI